MLMLKDLRCKAGGKTLLSLKRLSLFSGSFNAIIGPNGAGKTTLLKSISGDISYTGEILFHGLRLEKWSNLERARHIGVLPQSSRLSFPFCAQEVVALGLTPLSIGKREASHQIRSEMKRTDCLHLADKPFPSLSGGEKQRVQLARVLLQLSQATEAPLLLLDEPTSAQDLGQQHSLLQLTRELCKEQGYASLAILHDLNHVINYCNECYILNNGQLHLHGSPRNCLSPECIESFWGYKPEVVNSLNTNRTAII